MTSPPYSQAHLNTTSSVITIVGFFGSGYQFIHKIVYPSNGITLPDGLMHLYTILICGILAAIIQSVFWVLSEKAFRWNYGGGGKILPDGFPAIVLSLSITIPLIIAPILYGRLLGIQIVPAHHIKAAIAILFFGAMGHLLLYGYKRFGFQGIRAMLFPTIHYSSFFKGILMEFFYSVVHFCSIVLPYRLIVGSSVGHQNSSILWNLMLPAAVYFFGMTFFLVVKYPDSLNDKGWILVRGVIGGLLLTVTLQGGMLM